MSSSGSESASTRPSGPHLLVWVGNHPQAEALVQHASRLAAASGCTWTVISVETPATLHSAPWQRAHSLRALHLAQALGAWTDSVSGDSVLSVVVAQARRLHASTVLIGAHPPDGWFDAWQRPWLGGLAEALGNRLPGVTIEVLHLPAARSEPHPAGQRAAAAAPAASPARRWWVVVGVVALCTAISALMEHHFEPADQITVYFGGVAYLALRHGRAPAVVAVVLSILVFDWIFVTPRWGFNPHNPAYFFTFAVMALVGLLISRLAANAHLQALVADARAHRAKALNDLARALVAARSEAAIATGLTGAVHDTFGVASALLLPGPDGVLADPSGFCAPAPQGHADLAAARRAFESGNDAGGDGPGHAAAATYLPLRGDGRALGVLAVAALPARFGAPEDRHLLHAFANQAALALERAVFERRSAEAVVAAETERLRSTLLSGISHDFRTPLTTIVGAATSLVQQDRALDAARRELLLRSILDEARRMHASMSDLLDLTRMEEGAVQPDCEWCPADDLVEEVRSALGVRLAGRRVVVELPADAVVWCDARLVEQVLVNLLDNALRHTPPDSTITIRIELGADHWRLVVADDGPGLPPGQERDVFKKFFRARGEPSDTGTGLGLAICAAVARLHQGTISAANEGGARFTLTLPQPAAHASALEESA